MDGAGGIRRRRFVLLEGGTFDRARGGLRVLAPLGSLRDDPYIAGDGWVQRYLPVIGAVAVLDAVH